MIGTINNWVSKVVGTVKAPLNAIAPKAPVKKAAKAKVSKKAKKSRRK
ncbi:MAG TPA: hypothetical protein VLD37_05690 [Candidatus Bilamarchaeum sp.]|nr:hypothetical protein [Candidatus Bilamarchaeum sp.]